MSNFGIVPICGYGLVTVGRFGVVPLRKERSRFSFFLLRAGDSHLVHGPGRHSLFLPPGHDFRPFFVPEMLRRRSASLPFLGEFHLPCWRFIVVRHGGNVHWDVFSFLFLR